MVEVAGLRCFTHYHPPYTLKRTNHMKNLMKAIAVFLLVASMATPAFSESPATKPDDMKEMLKGKDSFFISPPRDWTVEIDDANAREMYAYFVLKGYTFETSPGVIYIRLMDKSGLTVADHLKADMDYYRKDSKVKFETFKVHGLHYTYAAKRYRIKDKSCDYVCYIDPDKEQQSYLIFVLTANEKNCSKYEGVFVDMLKSFSWGNKEPAPASSPQ
jgi:hypothetical protein